MVFSRKERRILLQRRISLQATLIKRKTYGLHHRITCYDITEKISNGGIATDTTKPEQYCATTTVYGY